MKTETWKKWAVFFGLVALCGLAVFIGTRIEHSHLLIKDSSRMTGSRNFWLDFPAVGDSDLVNAVIEIPAGTNEKWETSDSGELIEWEKTKSGYRVVQYLPYPANYGMVPGTLLSKDRGGDGDPLDIVLLGPSRPRGHVVHAVLIGVLKLTDAGEMDDKLIAVDPKGPLGSVSDMKDLDARYPGVSEILEIYFENYKGLGIMRSGGYGDRDLAMRILQAAVDDFQGRPAPHAEEIKQSGKKDSDS